jgi:sugar transferase (PEP-CTERM system associated)
VKIFGRYIALPFILLAALDASLFFSVLNLLARTSHCRACYVGALANLNFGKTLLLTGTFLLITTSVGLYTAEALKSFLLFCKRFVLAWQLILVPTIGGFALTKFLAGLPFGWYVGVITLASAIFMFLLFSVRAGVGWILRRPFARRRILVLGSGDIADQTVDFLHGPDQAHLQHVRTLPPPLIPVRHTAGGSLALHVQSETPLLAVARTLHADEIVVAMRDTRALPMHELLECKLNGIAVTDHMAFWEREAGQVDFLHTGADWFAFSDGFLLNQPHRLLKRISDFVVSLAFLIFFLPLILLTMLAIRLESPGPVFYRQERVGLDGKVFRVWKFRSMRVDAEKDGVPRWAGTTDSRVTRVGQFIRKVRIDEIPQIINVLAGDMSFIGPRPERPFFVEQLREKIPYYELRHRVKPGITGWAQVNYPYGASVEDARRKLAYDLYYVKNNDVFLDLAILVQTVRVILFAEGAR